eukprot:scaffold45966_cov46-Attheya_sp.AAC.6
MDDHKGGNGKLDLDDEWLSKLQDEFRSARITDEQLTLPPVRYPRKKGLQLTEVQVEWKTLAMSVVQSI